MQSAHLVSMTDAPAGVCIICGGKSKHLYAWNSGKTPLCRKKACAVARKAQRQRLRRRNKRPQLLLPLFV